MVEISKNDEEYHEDELIQRETMIVHVALATGGQVTLSRDRRHQTDKQRHYLS